MIILVDIDGQLVSNSTSSDNRSVGNNSTIPTYHRSLKIWSVGKTFTDTTYADCNYWSVNVLPTSLMPIVAVGW